MSSDLNSTGRSVGRGKALPSGIQKKGSLIASHRAVGRSRRTGKKTLESIDLENADGFSTHKSLQHSIILEDPRPLLSK